jgi:molybdopterin-guanine dinucleotide biosynthesis protein A
MSENAQPAEDVAWLSRAGKGTASAGALNPALESQATSRFAAALIAGGQSRRMGRDKAWIEWQGEPLWRFQLGKLAQLGPRQLFIACREGQHITSGEAEVLHDPPDNQGPLPALARCLARAQSPLLVLAVDMPGVTVALLRELIGQSAVATATKGAVFRGSHGYEPLCAMYPAAVLPLLEDSLARGNLRLQVFVQQAVDAGLMHVIPLSKEQEALFLNLNAPTDLA